MNQVLPFPMITIRSGVRPLLRGSLCKTLWRGAYKYRGVSSHGTHQPLGFARSDRWSTYDGPTDQADERADRLTRAVGE